MSVSDEKKVTNYSTVEKILSHSLISLRFASKDLGWNFMKWS